MGFNSGFKGLNVCNQIDIRDVMCIRKDRNLANCMMKRSTFHKFGVHLSECENKSWLRRLTQGGV